MEFIEVKNLTKKYVSGNIEVTAVDDISFEIKKGEIVVIVGASGAGKTTLLNILGGMDNLTYGQVIIDGKDISNYNDSQLTEYRRNDIGFVFQFYNLIQNLNAIENVELATQICTNTLNPEMVLEQVGLSNRIKNFPSQLSGGEQQRVAIARAIAKNPKILLCDEPTGALDYKTGKEVLKLLQDTANKNNMTVIIITHNQAIAPMANRVIKMKSGKIEENIINEKPVAIEEVEW
ncbi:aBC transporter related [Clostridium sp. CAG:798]|jgi:ABC transporter related|nr:aBC transporter related [Clostridium sp. CAG:798]HBJ12020.1 ABC transporter ATP-binding protein [Clostridiales bacterium]